MTLPEEADTDRSFPVIEFDGFHHLSPVPAPALSIASPSISLLWLKAAPQTALSELPSFVNSNSARNPFTLSQTTKLFGRCFCVFLLLLFFFEKRERRLIEDLEASESLTKPFFPQDPSPPPGLRRAILLCWCLSSLSAIYVYLGISENSLLVIFPFLSSF